MVTPGAACQTVTKTIAIHAKRSSDRMLDANGVRPRLSAIAGMVFENRKLNT